MDGSKRILLQLPDDVSATVSFVSFRWVSVLGNRKDGRVGTVEK